MVNKIKSNIKVTTYNIDGLPEKLDLRKLPLILRPIAYIYKLIKKTYFININDNSDTDKKITYISKYLSDSDTDIIGVQEDFNYHNELISNLKDKYNISTFTGGIDLSKIFTNVEIFSHFPLPRYKIDGLNLITKNDKIKVQKEHIEKWNNCFGYITHANDLLCHKGFRFYNILLDDSILIDVYILHMDADYQHIKNDYEKDLKARQSQLHQLSNFIIKRYKQGNINPIIIMGDTNCSPNRDFDIENINKNLINVINSYDDLTIEEAISEEFKDLDRIFFINNKKSSNQLKVKECYYDFNIDKSKLGGVSDHRPFTVLFDII